MPKTKIKCGLLNTLFKVIAISLLLLGCDGKREVVTAPDTKKTYLITGQAFVIQQNRINVKLGGVEIKYIDGPSFDVRLKWIAQNLDKAVALKSYIQDLDEIRLLAANNRIRYSEFVQREFFDSIDRFVELQMNRISAEPALVELINVQSGFETFNVEAFDPEKWIKHAIFGDWQDTQKFLTATTDADGEFSLEIPSGSRGFLLAESSRHLMDNQVEEYEWLYELAESITTPIHLTTLNTFNTEQLMNLADVFRNREPYTVDILCENYGLDRLSWAGQVKENLVKADTYKQKISANKERIEKLRREIQDLKEMSWVE
jgi:hypothetical protein